MGTVPNWRHSRSGFVTLSVVSSRAATGVLSAFSLYFYGRSCAVTGDRTLNGLWRSAWRRRGEMHLSWFRALPMALSNFVFCFGVCVAFVVLVGNFTVPVLDALFSDGPNGGQVPWLAKRNICVPLLMLALALPLSLLRAFKALRYASFIGIVAVAFTSILVVLNFISNGTGANQVLWWRPPSAFSLFLGVSVMNVAYAMHSNAPRFYTELQGRSPRRFATLSCLSMTLCTVLYVGVATAGYGRYGNMVCGDVLSSMGEHALVSLARVAMALSLVLTFPLPLNGARETLLTVLNLRHLDDKIEADRVTSVLATYDFDHDETEELNEQLSPKAHAIISVALLALSTLLGVVFPSIETILAFIGALGGTLCVYILPTIVFLRIVSSDQRTRKESWAATTCVIFGSVCGLVGIYASLTSEPSPEHCDPANIHS
ncbi:MAG: hypothetical protein MHM6MM_002837 [Cercozoa sp. M6MM]